MQRHEFALHGGLRVRTCFMTSAKLMASSMPGMALANSFRKPPAEPSNASMLLSSGVGSISCAPVLVFMLARRWHLVRAALTLFQIRVWDAPLRRGC